MLRQRLIYGSLLAVIVLSVLLLDGYLSTLPGPIWRPLAAFDAGRWLCNGGLATVTILVFTWLAAWELGQFSRIAGNQPFVLEAQIFAAGLVIGPYVSFNLSALTGWADESWGLLWIAIAIGVIFYSQASQRRTANAMGNLASTLFIIVYAGMAGYLTRLRMEVGGFQGIVVLLFTVFTVKMTDMGAFFVGSALGRHKMIVWLSPRKTWEGFFGGIVVAVLFSLTAGSLLTSWGLLPQGRGLLSPPAGLLIFGVLMGLFATAGDLCASLLKRDVAIKDSGNAIPGMGGVLDVLDSPLLAAPAAWFFWTRLLML